MSTDTLDGLDERLDIEMFEETDEPVACCFTGDGHSARAVGAIYIPKCGKHPMCEFHLEAHRKSFSLNMANFDTLTITCKLHNTVGSYNTNPAIIVRG